MSFGFSVSDIMNLLQLTARTYQGWKRACGEYSDITHDLESLKIVLSRVHQEIKVPTSLLCHHDKDFRQLKVIVRNCRDVVSQLEDVVSEYKNIVISRRSNWDKIRFGQKNLGGLRNKLMLQITALGAYLDVLGVSMLGRMEMSLEGLPEMKLVIDSIAADIRAGRKEGSVMTTYKDDDKHVWRQFRRDLIAQGFSSEHLKKAGGDLRRYVKKLDEAGLLDEKTPEAPADSPQRIDCEVTMIFDGQGSRKSVLSNSQSMLKRDTKFESTDSLSEIEAQCQTGDSGEAEEHTTLAGDHHQEAVIMSSRRDTNDDASLRGQMRLLIPAMANSRHTVVDDIPAVCSRDMGNFPNWPPMADTQGTATTDSGSSGDISVTLTSKSERNHEGGEAELASLAVTQKLDGPPLASPRNSSGSKLADYKVESTLSPLTETLPDLSSILDENPLPRFESWTEYTPHLDYLDFEDEDNAHDSFHSQDDPPSKPETAKSLVLQEDFGVGRQSPPSRPPRLLPCPKPPTIPTDFTQESWKLTLPLMEAYFEKWRSFWHRMHHYRLCYHDFYMTNVTIASPETCGYYMDWLEEDDHTRQLLEAEHQRHGLCMEQWVVYSLEVCKNMQDVSLSRSGL